MRKTPPHNPMGFERETWNYRCLQLRHALGWSQVKLARVMGVTRKAIMEIEKGYITRPTLPTIVAIKKVEQLYADILKIYKKAPVRHNRLVHKKGGYSGQRVHLLPIEIRRPEDIESLESMGASSEDMYFGRKTRRTMQQTGMSVQRKEYLRRTGQAIARTKREKAAARWSELGGNKEVQSGQPNDE